MRPPGTVELCVAALAGGAVFWMMSLIVPVRPSARLDPRDQAERLYDAADERLAAGDPGGAKALLEECLKWKPDDAPCEALLLKSLRAVSWANLQGRTFKVRYDSTVGASSREDPPVTEY